MVRCCRRPAFAAFSPLGPVRAIRSRGAGICMVGGLWRRLLPGGHLRAGPWLRLAQEHAPGWIAVLVWLVEGNHRRLAPSPAQVWVALGTGAHAQGVSRP